MAFCFSSLVMFFCLSFILLSNSISVSSIFFCRAFFPSLTLGFWFSVHFHLLATHSMFFSILFVISGVSLVFVNFFILFSLCLHASHFLSFLSFFFAPLLFSASCVTPRDFFRAYWILCIKRLYRVSKSSWVISPSLSNHLLVSVSISSMSAMSMFLVPLLVQFGFSLLL